MWRELWLLAELALLLLSSDAAPQQQRRQQQPQCASFDGGINMCGYESHRGLMRRLRELEDRFPRLAEVGSIGRSVEGRDLAYIKISANVSRRSPLEPMFRYVGNMHGDETVGRQVLIYLAEHLLNGYARGDERARRILDTTEVFIMPTLNPDGFARSKEGCGRGGGLLPFFPGGRGASGRENANGRDLNRDFPKRLRFQGRGLTASQLFNNRQEETNAMIRWILREPFVLSANMHGGAVVASYPYDDNTSGRAIDSPSPDDRTFRYLAATYANNHRFMSQSNSRATECEPGERFAGGITNGADWYVVAGGMQDFNYVYSNDLEVTLELSCCKHVPKGRLMEEWLNNKDALLSYLESVHLGVKGFVSDFADGAPIAKATVSVDGGGKKVRTTQQGEYWRVLAPGTYTISASAPGYLPSDPVSVTVSDRSWPPTPIIKHFALRRDPST